MPTTQRVKHRVIVSATVEWKRKTPPPASGAVGGEAKTIESMQLVTTKVRRPQSRRCNSDRSKGAGAPTEGAIIGCRFSFQRIRTWQNMAVEHFQMKDCPTLLRYFTEYQDLEGTSPRKFGHETITFPHTSRTLRCREARTPSSPSDIQKQQKQ